MRKGTHYTFETAQAPVRGNISVPAPAPNKTAVRGSDSGSGFAQSPATPATPSPILRIGALDNISRRSSAFKTIVSATLLLRSIHRPNNRF